MRLNAEFTTELYELLTEEAARQGRSISDVLRQLVQEWVDKMAKARERQQKQKKEMN